MDALQNGDIVHLSTDRSTFNGEEVGKFDIVPRNLELANGDVVKPDGERSMQRWTVQYEQVNSLLKNALCASYLEKLLSDHFADSA
jgi:hypothetical protein